jgi:formate-dependent nitrite reductase membrane component NrfD
MKALKILVCCIAAVPAWFALCFCVGALGGLLHGLFGVPMWNGNVVPALSLVILVVASFRWLPQWMESKKEREQAPAVITEKVARMAARRASK